MPKRIVTCTVRGQTVTVLHSRFTIVKYFNRNEGSAGHRKRSARRITNSNGLAPGFGNVTYDFAFRSFEFKIEELGREFYYKFLPHTRFTVIVIGVASSLPATKFVLPREKIGGLPFNMTRSSTNKVFALPDRTADYAIHDQPGLRQ